MNRLLLVWIVLQLSISPGVQSNPGFRKLRADEAAWFTKMHYKLAGAVSHSFYNWECSDEDGEFDAMRIWSPDQAPNDSHLGDCPESLGKSEPYSCRYQVEFKMPEKESRMLLLDTYQKIKDYSNKAQVAAALKASAVTRVTISITTNVAAPVYNKLVYCAGAPPVVIPLPVHTSLALLGTHLESCPAMKDGKLDMNGDYYDNALIFLGKRVIKKSVLRQTGGLTEANYVQDFDWSKTGRMSVQNMVISVRGDAPDIRVALKLIDWKKLYRLIGK